MMFIQHKSNNKVYGAPQGWDQKVLPVGALPVTQDNSGAVMQTHSFWKPDATELALILQGKPIVLTVHGNGHPIVSMGVLAGE